MDSFSVSLVFKIGSFLMLGASLTSCMFNKSGADSVYSWFSSENDYQCVSPSGKYISETRVLNGFNSIELKDSYNVKLTQSERYEVRFEGDEALLKNINTTIENGLLTIENQDCFSDEIIIVYISMPKLNGVTISGAGEVTSTNKFTSDSVAFDISGAGEVSMELDAKDKVNVDVSGSGSIDLSGKTKLFNIDVSGASDVVAFDFEAEDVKIDISGASDANINAQNTLSVDVSGRSDISYKGNPTITAMNVSGSGEVEKMVEQADEAGDMLVTDETPSSEIADDAEAE